MKQETAQLVLDLAKSDERITASLIDSYARPDGNGYQVHLELRRGLRVLVARDWQGWLAIKAAWRGL